MVHLRAIIKENKMSIYSRFKNKLGHINAMKKAEFKMGKKLKGSPTWFKYFPSKYNKRIR